MNHYGFVEMFQPKSYDIHMFGTFFNLCHRLNGVVNSVWFVVWEWNTKWPFLPKWWLYNNVCPNNCKKTFLFFFLAVIVMLYKWLFWTRASVDMYAGSNLLSQGYSLDYTFSDDENDQPGGKRRLLGTQESEPFEQV